MNEDIVVMDAEMAGSSGCLYDINEQVQRLYEFNLDDSQQCELQFPPMKKEHRGVVFNLTKKYGLVYVSAPKKEGADENTLSSLSVVKPKGYKGL